MFRKIFILALLAAVIGLPFTLRKEEDDIVPDETLIIITPHNESVRYEFAQGFRNWYKAKTGKIVAIDWRVLGGTSEVIQFINATYLQNFKNYWTNTLGRDWNMNVQQSFADAGVELGPDPKKDTEAQRARRKFLESEVTSGIDLMFGGGNLDFIHQAEAGRLVNSGILELHPEWFGEGGIPEHFAGDVFWDSQGRWVGTAISSFGITYNHDSLERLGIDQEPTQWVDLASDKFYGEVGLADPTKSGAINKAFEMVVHQQMSLRYQELLKAGAPNNEETEMRAVREGWMRALRILQRMAANSRYFTDAASKPSIDVSQGNCAVGMSIDFYGRFQRAVIEKRSGRARFDYITPEGGSSLSADPIGMLRGAKHPELALAFIEYALSVEGQKIIHYRVGAPGGPVRYSLLRPPIRPEMYEEPHVDFTDNSDRNPFMNSAYYIHYKPDWTKPVFDSLRFIFRVVYIDVHHELREAWGDIIQARKEGRDEDARRALTLFNDLSAINYDEARGPITDAINSRDKIHEMHLADELARRFRNQFKEVSAIAKGEKKGAKSSAAENSEN